MVFNSYDLVSSPPSLSHSIFNYSIFFWTKFDVSSLSAEGLDLAFCCSIILIICPSYLEYLEFIGGYTPKVTDFISPSISSAWNGGSSVVIS